MAKSEINQLKAGSILSYINIFISCIIPMFYTPVMLSMLGQAEYGVYSISNSVISYLSILNFGMGNAVVRYVSKYRALNQKENIRSICGLFIVIYCFLAILVCIVGFSLTNFTGTFFGNGLTGSEINRLKILIIIMTVSTAISFPSSVFSSVITSHEKYIFRKVIDMLGTILSPILNLVMLFIGYASIGMAMAGVIIQLLTLFINMWYCIAKLNIIPKFVKCEIGFLKELFGFSGFIFLMTIVDMLYWATDKVLIGALIGSVAVAIYNVGGTFTGMLQNMSSAISNVFVPRITTMVFKGNSKLELTGLLIKVGRIQYLIVSFILSGYITFGQDFILLWLGSDYNEAYYIALLTMIPISVPLIQNVALNIIIAQNKHKFRAIIYAIIAIVNVIGTYLVIPKFGIIGAALCTAISYVIGNIIIMNIYYYKITGLDIPLFWKNIFSMSVVPLIIMIIFMFIINYVININTWLCFFVMICIYSVIYIIFTCFFSMNLYEKNLAKDLMLKMRNMIFKRNFLGRK